MDVRGKKKFMHGNYGGNVGSLLEDSLANIGSPVNSPEKQQLQLQDMSTYDKLYKKRIDWKPLIA